MGFKLTTEQLQNNNRIVNIRGLLHQYIYTAEFIEIIKNELQNNIELFSIHNEGLIITLKIKKTILKKNSDYEHDSLYYYNIINSILFKCIYDSIYHIADIISCNTDISKENIISTLLDQNNIPILYNITALGDNIVVIYL